MSRIISDILQTGRPNFQRTLLEWEERSGRAGHDVRLLSDMRVSARGAIEALGLDAHDTAPAELYFALQGRAKSDNEWLSAHFGIKAGDSPDKVLKKIIKWLEKDHLPEAWVCKVSVIKTALKKQPPKTLMKALGLRSADSMLKRNSPAELLPLALLLESSQWKTKFRTEFKKFKPTDFDVRTISLHLLDAERVEKLAKNGFHHSRIVTPCYETGSLAIIPPKQRFNLDVLAITSTLLETIGEIRRHSAYYRTISVRKDFGKQLQATSELGIVKASQKLSHIGWNSVHRHLVGNELFFDRLEQPYLTKNDVYAPSAAVVLSGLDPRFSYWQGLDYVLVQKGAEPPVSMHLVDVVTNASNRLTYPESVSTYGRARLWDELWGRYLSHEPTAENVVKQFLGDEDL